MSTQVLATKLYIPPTRPQLVPRPRLLERLNGGLRITPGVTLISAPAGFGKTTLLSEWINENVEGGRMKAEVKETIHPSSFIPHPSKVSWLSLDEGDNDPARFLTYLIAALQIIEPNIGNGMADRLQSPQPPPPESILTDLLNEIAAIPDRFVLVLDDYHAIDAKPVDRALAFLLDHLPPQMHLVIATREDPDLPLARLRSRGHLTELRAADLRFTLPEAADFLNQVMRLDLSAEDIAALETRTEGWIAGLQLAALSMQGQKDAASFIQSFTGSHRFVLDYLVEEVLGRQPEGVQTFLLQTSILSRMCGPLCDAVLGKEEGRGMTDEKDTTSVTLSFRLQPSSLMLEYLERANLFIIPLDNERRWYRYHHLFADLLRQRLHQSFKSSSEDAGRRLNELHIRASQWYEDNGFEMDAFQHAAAANDIERAERLMHGKTIPLHFSGGVTPLLEWLESLPKEVLNARPSLWWRHAALLLINGQTTGVGEKLEASETALAAILKGAEPDEETRNLIGQIATARSTLALTRYDVETMLAQSRRALEYLHPDSLFNRASANWTKGYAYALLGDRLAARQALTEAVSLSQASGAMFTLILATIGLGLVQEMDNQLHQAAETYRQVLQWAGDHPQQIIGEAHLGLSHILYEWDDLDAAEQHVQQSLQLARQYESFIDRFVIAEVFLARLKLARGDVPAASTILAKTEQSVRQHNFVHRMPELAAAQVLTLLRQGNLEVAGHLAEEYRLPMSQARVHLAKDNPAAALTVLRAYRKQVESQNWHDERLKAMVLESIALQAQGEEEQAVQVLGDALALAKPEGFIRVFVDEGRPMADLLARMNVSHEGGAMREYIHKLQSAFNMQEHDHPSSFLPQPLIEPLTQRELEVLQLIAQGLSNDEIGKRLFLALDTVKGHNRRIFDKLQVQRRTEAVARARELGLL